MTSVYFNPLFEDPFPHRVPFWGPAGEGANIQILGGESGGRGSAHALHQRWKNLTECPAFLLQQRKGFRYCLNALSLGPKAQDVERELRW